MLMHLIDHIYNGLQHEKLMLKHVKKIQLIETGEYKIVGVGKVQF